MKIDWTLVGSFAVALVILAAAVGLYGAYLACDAKGGTYVKNWWGGMSCVELKR